MHSSAFGAAARMVLRSFSSAARLSALKAARYSSMVLGCRPWLMLSAQHQAPEVGNGWSRLVGKRLLHRELRHPLHRPREVGVLQASVVEVGRVVGEVDAVVLAVLERELPRVHVVA